MEKFLDRFVNWLLTSCFLLIAVFFIGLAIDNLRVVVNMILIIVAFLLIGFIIYEVVNYVYKKLTNT